jgi:hypothetical protein
VARNYTHVVPQFLQSNVGECDGNDCGRRIKKYAVVQVVANILEWLSPRTQRKHRWAMPMRLLSGDGAEIRAKLLDEGLLLSPGRKAKEKFLEFLTTVEPSERVI